MRPFILLGNWVLPPPLPQPLASSCMYLTMQSKGPKSKKERSIPIIYLTIKDALGQPRPITVSLNQLERCQGDDNTPQRVDFDLLQLEEADGNAEVPMRNSWVTTDDAAATRALNQDVGDVYAPSLREGRTTSACTEPQRTQLSVVYPDDISPSILIPHEHTNVVSPSDRSDNTQRSPLHADSATMTASDLPTSSVPLLETAKTWEAPRSQTSFAKSSQVWPCSSPVLDEGTLPVVPEVLQDDVFTPPSSPRHGSSTTVMELSTPDTAPLDPDNGGLRGQAFSLLAMINLVCVLSYRPSTTADRFALHNKYGVVGNRYHLTAYDCSDSTEVQA